MKLSKRFLFVPIVLASFSYLFYSAYKEVKDRTLNEFNAQQFALAKQASRGIESFFIYYQGELQFLSKLKYVSELNNQGRNLLADFYNSHSDQIEAITITDTKGILKYTYPYNESVIGQDISSQVHVRAMIETQKPTVSDVFTTVQGSMAIAFHIPIITENEYKGSIAILIPFDKLGKRFIENISTGETGYGWMISENGIVLFNPVAEHTGKAVKETYNKFPTVLEMLDKTLKEQEGTSICYISSTTDDKKELSKTLTAFYRVSLGNTFWTIIIYTPEKEVFATLTSFRNHLYILFSLIIIVMVSYFYLAFKAGNITTQEKKRKAVEDIVFESEKRSQEKMLTLSRALESIWECVSITDLNNKIIFVNNAFCNTYGYYKEELIGQDIGIFRSFKTCDKLGEKILSDTMLGGWNGELINFKKDGSEFPIELSTSLIKDDKDNAIALIGIAVDITEREKVYKELVASKKKAEESDKLKTAFLTNMSHELRTPLNAIIGLSSFMIDTCSDPETISYLKIILNSGQHLLGLVEEILDISLIETQQIKINYERISVNSILNEVKDIIHGEILQENKTEIKLVLNIDPVIGETTIFTDSRKLKQVLLNLLKNSLKFTDKGYIEFGITEIEKDSNKYLRFYVKDTGIGIDKKHHEVIFNIFRQIDDTQTRNYRGTGIGLSISKKIIEMLGGEIWVESELGKGSVFFFIIPFLSEGRQKENKTFDAVKVSENNFSGKTILVVEDEVSNFDFLRIFFTKMNIRVLWAKTGVEAVNLCETDPSINLVFMDIKIPLMNGYEATKSIKNKRPELTVIAQTAYAAMADKEEALKSGCDDYLSKPIQIEQLKDMLKKYL